MGILQAHELGRELGEDSSLTADRHTHPPPEPRGEEAELPWMTHHN